MNGYKLTVQVIAVIVAMLLSGCGTNSNVVVYSGQETLPEAPASVPEEPAPVPAMPDNIRRAMILADMLYAAKQAYEDNRLLAPTGDNAYDRYQEVLSIFPENEVALAGLDEIIERYVQMADSAMGIGQYDEAEDLLDRAAFIGRNTEIISAARGRLEEARKTRIEMFPLDPAGLNRKSIEILSTLGEIGQFIMQQEGLFLITARNDEEGRWIYMIMREAVGGYRLRGNIAIGDTPSVQVSIPST